MKIQKRLLATFLAVSMVFILSTAAFAEDNSNAVTSTGNNATADKDTENKADITVNGTYLSELESDPIISVNVAWTDMNFEYAASQQGTWDPTDHTYGGASNQGKWLKDSATITVTNHSNEKITANLIYEQTDTGVTGTLDQTELNLANAAEGDSLGNTSKAPSEEVGFTVSGTMNTNGGDLGTITVSIEKKTEEETPDKNPEEDQDKDDEDDGVKKIYSWDDLSAIAENGGTAKLMNDITEASKPLSVGKDLTLDLNNCTLTMGGNGVCVSSNCTVNIENGTLVNSKSGPVIRNTKGTVTLNYVQLETSATWVYYASGTKSALTMNNCTVTKGNFYVDGSLDVSNNVTLPNNVKFAVQASSWAKVGFEPKDKNLTMTSPSITDNGDDTWTITG